MSTPEPSSTPESSGTPELSGIPNATSRRTFLVLSAATATTVALVDFAGVGSSAAATGPCASGDCSTTTLWMLDPDWGYPRGPHAKTRLVSRASRAAVANRMARTEADALSMNLHKCSFAPAVGVPVCTSRADRAFDSWARDWNNPWSGDTVSVLDLRHVPADADLFACAASAPAAVDRAVGAPGGATTSTSGLTGPHSLAFTGASDRRALFIGVGALAAGAVLRALGRKDPALDAGDPIRPD